MKRALPLLCESSASSNLLAPKSQDCVIRITIGQELTCNHEIGACFSAPYHDRRKTEWRKSSKSN
jgi:hypothetical protein